MQLYFSFEKIENQPSLDCNKHNDKAIKCKFVKAVYRIDYQCEEFINQRQAKFDNIYDKILKQNNKNIYYYLNSQNHVLKYHKDDLKNVYLNNNNNNKCLNVHNECFMLARNYICDKFGDNAISCYVDNIKKRSNDIHQMLFFQGIDSFHEILYHPLNISSYIEEMITKKVYS